MPVDIGDATLRFLADTSELDNQVSQLIDKAERALAAFKAEWNKQREAKTEL